MDYVNVINCCIKHFLSRTLSRFPKEDYLHEYEGRWETEAKVVALPVQSDVTLAGAIWFDFWTPPEKNELSIQGFLPSSSFPTVAEVVPRSWDSSDVKLRLSDWSIRLFLLGVFRERSADRLRPDETLRTGNECSPLVVIVESFSLIYLKIKS